MSFHSLTYEQLQTLLIEHVVLGVKELDYSCTILLAVA